MAKKTVTKEQQEGQTLVEDNFDPYKVIRFPLSTEKSIRQIEFDNKLAFVVHPRSTKRDIKRAVEQLFKVKVIQVNVQNFINGQKRAYVKLSAGNVASDVSADLGLI
ncbi:50S ribosomal protein L23 [Candidatus Woesearchaeota archaeon CG_4_10_14_0_2_um_filter_33_13]|nr:MAG: 50S ribosomal protein L23 [Candidatus Woesearchaeota archaeon CG_4_10_14_0_2_um_filter_33_13]